MEFCTESERRVTVGPYRPNIAIFFTILAVCVSFVETLLSGAPASHYMFSTVRLDFCSYCSISTRAPFISVMSYQVREITWLRC